MKIPNDTLSAIQKHFHALIRERAGELIDKHNIPLPELAPLLEQGPEATRVDPDKNNRYYYGEKPGAYFGVDGMYGGFSYRLKGQGSEAVLVVESWCRIVQGSGQRHEVTADGHTLTGSGFV